MTTRDQQPKTGSPLACVAKDDRRSDDDQVSVGAKALAQMWAKTGPDGSWHQLAYHLLDVAAVARLLLERHVPHAVRRRHAAP